MRRFENKVFIYKEFLKTKSLKARLFKKKANFTDVMKVADEIKN